MSAYSFKLQKSNWEWGFYKNKSFGSSTITGFAANQYLIADWLFQGISEPFRASRNPGWGQVPDLIFATALPTIVGYLVLKKQAWHSTKYTTIFKVYY